MKLTYKLFIIVVAMVFIIGQGLADIPINATTETMGLTSSTLMKVQGISSAVSSLSMQLGTNSLNDPPLENGGYPWEWWAGDDMPMTPGYTLDSWVAEIYGTPAPTGEIQYTAGYNEYTTAVSGTTNYLKTSIINTANRVIDQENIEADRIVTFSSGNGGRIISSEDLLIDGAGAQTVAAEHILCPFADTENQFFPPFCNIVSSGSSQDLSVGSFTTSASGRFIANSADVPIQENYQIRVTGISGTNGYSDAVGMTTAYMKAHLQESRELEIPRYFDTDPIGYTPSGKSDDLIYSESSSASGQIRSFNKNMLYQSGIRTV